MPLTVPSTPQVYPGRVAVDPLLSAVAQTNWSTQQLNNNMFKCGGLLSSGAQNAAVSWDVLLGAGTWTLQTILLKQSNVGIYDFGIDGVSVGTVDGYSVGAVNNSANSIAGIVIATPGVKRFSVTMATKNASASSYFGQLNVIEFLRTA